MSASSSTSLIVDVFYSGIFLKNPLIYSLGVVKTIHHVDFGNMEFNDLVEFIEKVTKSKCTGLYYCVYGKTLSTGLRVIQCDLDIYRFLDHVLASGGRIALYIDHYNENLTDFIGEDNLTDLVIDVNMATNDNASESSDHSYQSQKEEDEVSNLISSDHEDNNARRKPIITMLEEIRTYVMQRIFKMSTLAEKLEHGVCPTTRKKLECLKVKQRHWSVIPSDYSQFEVRNEHVAFVVDIVAHTCSCRAWQLSGIPCVHTVAALAFLNKDPETYVNNWLRKDMLKEAYRYPIKPLNGSSLWPKTDGIKPLPPKERRMPGRPTIKRKRDACEKEIKYSKVGIGRKMTCTNCQEKGHNNRSCKKQKKTHNQRK